MSEGRILVIDDSEFVLAKVKSILTQAGYDVQTTTQTVGAARYLRSCDLTLVDFHMPGIDGAQVLTSLKSAAKSAGSTCAFYLFTSDTDLAIRYASFGFDGAIRHKGDQDTLLPQVRAALRMKKMREIALKKKPDSSSGLASSELRSSPPGSPSPSPSVFVPATARRTGFPPPRPASDQDDDDAPLTADFPRTPT
jgi:DNA-binding NarL/FixJ family response regulator